MDNIREKIGPTITNLKESSTVFMELAKTESDEKFKALFGGMALHAEALLTLVYIMADIRDKS